jgi:hypothetical protein
MTAKKIDPVDCDVLLLGLNHDEGISSQLATYGFTYARKGLNSSPNNWQKINDILLSTQSNDKMVVIAKITENNLFCTLLPDYQQQFSTMFGAISGMRHLCFIYDGTLSGDFTCFKFDPWKEKSELHESLVGRLTQEQMIEHEAFQKYLYTDIERWKKSNGVTSTSAEIKEMMEERISTLQDAGIKLIPYRKWSDIRIATMQFLNEAKRGLILRIYLSEEKFLANEFEKLLKLFVDYLRKAQSLDISIDQSKTNQGQIVEFYSKDGDIRSDQLAGLLQNFSHFLDVCSVDIDQAVEMIGPTRIPKDKLNDLISRYAKEARRLILDVRQEKEKKLLSIRHRIQSEIIDLELESEQAELGANLAKQMNDVVTENFGLLNMAGIAPGSITIMQQPNLIFHNPVIAGKINNIIAQEINGDILYDSEELELLRLMRDQADDVEYAELKSAVDQLKDGSVSEPQKTTSWQRIKAFAVKHSDKMGSLGLKIAEKIIDKYVFGKT